MKYKTIHAECSSIHNCNKHHRSAWTHLLRQAREEANYLDSCTQRRNAQTVLICFSYKKERKKSPSRGDRTCSDSMRRLQQAGGAQRPRRNLDIKLIHLKSDSPLRAKAVENANKHTLNTHRCIVQTLSLSLINT